MAISAVGTVALAIQYGEVSLYRRRLVNSELTAAPSAGTLPLLPVHQVSRLLPALDVGWPCPLLHMPLLLEFRHSGL